MEASRDAFERLIDSPLYGGPDEPVARGGRCLRGITKALHERYGGGHLAKRVGRSSRDLGTRVHRELHAWVANPRSRRRCALHPWTRQALEVLDAHGLRPLGTEVPVAHGGIGTRVDLIARRVLRGGCALVSVKTGVRRGPDAGPRRALPPPFSEFKRCERTLDDLQIATESGLARKGHGVLFDSAYVLEVPAGVLREAPSWVKEEKKQDALLHALARKNSGLL